MAMALPLLAVRPVSEGRTRDSRLAVTPPPDAGSASFATFDANGFAPRVVFVQATEPQPAGNAATTAEETASPEAEPTQPAEGSATASDGVEPQAAAAAAPETAASKEAGPAKKQAERHYTVRKGDALSKIARRHGVSLRSLLNANGLRMRSVIRPGMRLKIPAPGAQAGRAAPRPEGRDGGPVGLATPVAAENSDSSRLHDSALKYRGVPYRYAGMSSRGMDCSGLVARVLQAHGMRAPHNSRALFRLGKPVSRAELKPDDLVFFSTRGQGVSHVGIYLGEGKFVHASSGGGRVQVSSLDSGYYARRFVGARRIGG